MAKGKPTPEVRTPAPADPLDAFDAAVAAPEGAEPPAGTGEVRTSAPPTPGPGEAAAALQQEVADRLAAAAAEVDRLKAENEALRATVRMGDEAGGRASPAPGRYAVTCGHLPDTVVEAVDTADAVRQYQKALGVWSLPSVPEVKPHAGPVAADPPEQP